VRSILNSIKRGIAFLVLLSTAAFLCGQLPDKRAPVLQQITAIQHHTDELMARFFRAVAAPGNAYAEQLMHDLAECEDRLIALNESSQVPPIFAAEKYRRIALVAILQARIWRERITSHQTPTSMHVNAERSRLATEATDAIQKARYWIDVAKDPSNSSQAADDLRSQIKESEIEPHVTSLEATAHAIKWEIDHRFADREAAQAAWKKLPAAYRREYYPPSPELADVLGITSDESGHMTLVAWTGIGLLILAVTLVFVFGHPSAIQIWVIRVVVALGATLLASVVPGFLNVNISGYITAGGTLAALIIFYWFNPPKLQE
jgi:hypothetical protein